jgi:hypothetical protein
MAFGDCSGGDLDFILMVLDPEISHTLVPRFDAADVYLHLFLSDMLFHITMNESRENLDIAAAEVVYADCLESREADRPVLGAVGNRGQIQELRSGTWLA